MRKFRGDSQSGSAANDPIRSAFILVFLPSLSELFRTILDFLIKFSLKQNKDLLAIVRGLEYNTSKLFSG